MLPCFSYRRFKDIDITKILHRYYKHMVLQNVWVNINIWERKALVSTENFQFKFLTDLDFKILDVCISKEKECIFGKVTRTTFDTCLTWTINCNCSTCYGWAWKPFSMLSIEEFLKTVTSVLVVSQEKPWRFIDEVALYYCKDKSINLGPPNQLAYMSCS